MAKLNIWQNEAIDKKTNVTSIKMFWRFLFKKLPKSHKTPYRESSDVIKISKNRRLIKLLILIMLAVSCMYWFKQKKYLKTTKFILIWDSDEWYPFDTFKTGRESFIEKNCPFTNCFIVHRRHWKEEIKLKMFDAIAFNGRATNPTRPLHDVPMTRYDHQKYILFHTESADNYPICHASFDGFFNWTATYKLDSDILYAYITIKNKFGDEIGPRSDMKWREASEISVARLNKSRAVAWFVSNCNTRSNREYYVMELYDELTKQGLDMDVYGTCGWLNCSRGVEKCDELLNNYYFYLSFENSFAEDYVTEKLMAPLQNNNVPIVYGGANYSRFLPPKSYLDARKLSPKELAATVARLISHPEEYYQYLSRSRPYSYSQPVHECRLCAALNDEALMEQRHSYEDLRRWWHPEYEKRCTQDSYKPVLGHR